MPDTPASPLLAEALDFLEAIRIKVVLAPLDGLWRLMLGEEVVSTGNLVARAVALGMMGVGAPLQQEVGNV